MRTKAAEEEQQEEEEGSRRGSLVEGDPAADSGTGARENRCLDPPGRQLMPPAAQGWCPWMSIAIVVPDTAHRPWSQAQLRMHLKPNQCISCGLFSHVWRHQGNGNPGVIPCHYVLLLKARKVYFSVTQWRHTPEREKKKKSKDTEIVTFEFEI